MTHGDHDDGRSIRRIALRILNEDEDEARVELDNILYGIEDTVELRSIFYNWSLPIILICPFFFGALSLIIAVHSKALGNIFYGIAIICACAPIFVWWNWSHLQYGWGKRRHPRDAHYVDTSDESKEKLEKLFAYMQRDSAPRAYYRVKNFAPRYLDRNYTFGSLRVLLLSASPSVRALCLSPSGHRISAPIKIEADPDEVIKALNVKPKRKGGQGAKVKYPYIDAVLWLIDEPRLNRLDLTNRDQAIDTIKIWLSDWFKDHVDESGDIPRNDQLKPFAEKIHARQEKISPLKRR
jgi:hypothetical protein